ncbi:MAG: hypothetical protein KF760_08115 [Candidatus Eremiobacteraeota bacterium]|nr:hypothetical protein [Candidatus Eremiobacteraeota bacterium]MCW5867967.1 hypothetical protein [Candidatus Eremiobacteraeota bacterium]
MDSFKFPQPLVIYLNAVEAGCEAEEERQALLLHLKDIGEWLRHESQLLVGPEEEMAFNELRSLGSELTEVLSCSYVRLEQVSHEFALALSRFRALRSRLRFVDLVEFDELMQAAVALSNGRDCRAEVERRLMAAVQLLQNLAEQISAQEPWLPPAVNEALAHGVEITDEGLLRLHRWLNEGKGLRQAILMLKDGANLLGYFVRWRLEQCGWFSPLADNRLWSALYSLQQDLARGLEVEFPLGKIQGLAEEYRGQRLLGATQHTVLWSEWDDLMEGDPLLVLNDLVALVEDMERSRLDTGRAFATFLEPLVLAGSGAWAGTLPNSYLQREWRALFPRAMGQEALSHGLESIGRYLSGGQRVSLCRGLEVVLECAETCSNPETVLSGMRCRCCQQIFDPADPSDRCIGQSSHQYLAVCA